MMLNILLVDDNQTFLAAVRQFLNRLSATHVVAEAHDGREALNKAAEFRPDLMLLDVAMPHLRHLTLAGEILSCTLLTLHNLHFYLDLMAQARAHIEAGDYASWHRAWIERYEAGAAARTAGPE